MKFQKPIALLLALLLFAGCGSAQEVFLEETPLLPAETPIETATPTPEGTDGPSDSALPTEAVTDAPTIAPTAVPTSTFTAPPQTPKPTKAPTAPPTATPAPTPTLQTTVSLQSASYGYAEMTDDLQALAAEFPDSLTLRSLGKSEFGRDIPLAILGGEDNPRRVLIVSTTHAREYGNSLLAMSVLERYLRGADTLTYNGKTVREMLNETSLWIVPMHNPDGVELCLHGLDSVPEAYQSTVSEIYQRSVDKGLLNKGSFARWKANGLGIDLNENYGLDAGNGSYQSRPMSEGYPGSGVPDAAEGKLIVDLIRSRDFLSVVCFHSVGEIVYWGYRAEGELRSRCQTLVKAICRLNGYAPHADGASYKYMGLKDWFMKEFKRPGFTVETCSGSAPVSLAQAKKAIEKNLLVPLCVMAGT